MILTDEVDSMDIEDIKKAEAIIKERLKELKKEGKFFFITTPKVKNV